MSLPAFSVEKLQFRGGGPTALTYEAALHSPAGGGPWPGVIICHSHPHFGSSMDLPICRELADRCAAQGLMALRFNFRGIGLSTGVSTADEHEFEDLRAALEFLHLHPLLAEGGVGVVGYSFGAWVGLNIAEQLPTQVAAYVGIGFGLTKIAPGWRPTYPGPTCFIHGTRDQIIPFADLEAFYARVHEPKELHALSADHFFIGHQAAVASLALKFLKPHLRARH